MNAKTKSVLSIIGFILFILGGISIVLSLVGLRLTIMAPFELLGTGVAFVIKILITIFGIIMVYLARTTTIED